MQFTVHQPPAQPEELRQLIDKLKFRSRFLNQVQWRFKSSAADIKLITRAYDWNADLFRGKRRMSGGSFMNGHLVPVAILGMEYHQIQDAEQIVAYLSHDAVEDYREFIFRYTIENTFGMKAGRIVWGATKPRRTTLRKRSVEYLQSVVARVETGGVECVFMKCNADRLQNMLTLFGTPEKKRWKIWETEKFYIPLLRKYNLPDGELRLAVKQQRERLHINDFQ